MPSEHTNELPAADQADQWLRGSEMAERIRAFDWSKTPLGLLEQWPQSLRTAVSMSLHCAFPIVLWWGPELLILYNDEYRAMLGAEKHPSALGAPGATVWAEIWHIVGPMLESVMRTGKATRSRDLLLHIDRGYLEEAYFSFSYSPIYGESGEVAGVFCPVIETTEKIIGERRLRTLRDLATATKGAATEQAVFDTIGRVLSENPRDLPFSLVYRVDPSGEKAMLAASSGFGDSEQAAPEVVSLGLEDGLWSLASVVRSGKPTVVRDLSAFQRAPRGAWATPPTSAVVKPILVPGADRPHAVLIAAVSPMRALDEAYETFFELLSNQIGSALADAQALEAERRRAASLAALDRAKTTFFSNVSHELRTPLTLMLGPIEEELRANPASARRLELAHRNSLRLLKLVNSLLDFSRIEAGRISANYVPTDLAALTTELSSVFRSAVEKAGLSLVVECPPLPQSVYVDREMWEKIVLNLLSNAFKFTFEGQIAVRLEWNDDRVDLTVQDTGVGIPDAELPRMFERFHRAKHPRARTHEGTGIGLALVQELARLHGGDVVVHSREGEGTRFVVSVRTGRAHLQAERISAEQEQPLATSTLGATFLDEARRWLPDPDGEELLPQEPPTGHGSTAVMAARVLVVDDNADMRAYLAGLLSRQCEVLTSADGQEALSVLRAQPVDLLVSDVMMPGLDGFELLAAIRTDDRLRHLPVVLLSARAGEEARLEGLAGGADAYLVKPFSARELLVTVASQLQLLRLRQEHERSARQALEEADRRKDEFLALLAHELRNPLAPVRHAIEILRRTASIGGDNARLTEVIARQINQMTRLIDDLLNVSRISRGQIDLQRQPTDLASVVMHATELARPEIEQRQLDLNVALAPGRIVLHADSTRLVQVVGNLLNNAAKFSPPGGSIKVSAERAGHEAVIRVRDSGIGIDPSRLADVFGMFVQLDTSLERKHAGLGLGLTIVKSLVELHGGSVEARSEGLGKGAEFVVRLPLPVESLKQPQAPGPGSANSAFERRRVLVVEDNQDSAMMLAELLTLEGHQVHTTPDGIQGLAAISSFQPDIVLLDLGLPELNGYEVARRIRAMPDGERVRLIALTGWGQVGDRARSSESGFDAHLVKPVDPTRLMRLMAVV